jgi:pSer/pThr/pTyr-binding forkhead associated (FHA) protein
VAGAAIEMLADPSEGWMTSTCTLKVTSGPVAGSEVQVERELIIGRREADLTIPDEELSRRHAAVRPAATGVIVEDLGSLNGTFVNGERISAPITLTSDATIRVGTSEMSLQLAIVVAAPELEEHAADTGRTRLAKTLPPDGQPQAPAPIPQPQVTRMRPVPGTEPPAAQPQEPVPTPQSQVTRIRPAVPDGGRSQVEGAPQADTGAGGQEQGEPPGALRRLLGRIPGWRRGAKRADG